MNRDLDYVLNYMTKYVKDIYMHDSEPMLNYKDIEIVLKHIYELQAKITKAIEYINVNQNEETLCLNYHQLKKLRDILRGE